MKIYSCKDVNCVIDNFCFEKLNKKPSLSFPIRSFHLSAERQRLQTYFNNLETFIRYLFVTNHLSEKPEFTGTIFIPVSETPREPPIFLLFVDIQRGRVAFQIPPPLPSSSPSLLSSIADTSAVLPASKRTSWLGL